MTGPFLIEPLAGAHERRTFDSGNAALDRYRHYGFRPLASRPLSFFLPFAEAARQLKTR